MKKNFYHRTAGFLALCCICAVSLSLFTGCNEEDIPFMEVSEQHVDLASDVLSHRIEVKSNCRWQAASDSDWCKVVGGEGNFKGAFDLVLESNGVFGDRSAKVTVSAADMSIVIVVRQKSPDLKLMLSHDKLEFNREADSYLVKVACNNVWEASASHSWCEVTATDNPAGHIRISVGENRTGKERNAKVIVSTEGKEGPIMETIDITQTAQQSQLIVSPAEKEVGPGDEDFSISVTATAGWKAIPDCDWLSMDKTAGESDEVIRVEVAANGSAKPRTGTITFSTTSQDTGREVRTVTVIQGVEGFDVLADEVNISGMGETVTISVVSAQDFGVRSSSAWCEAKAKPGEKSVDITAKLNNTGTAREALITVSSLADPAVCKTFKVIQSSVDVAFEITPGTCEAGSEGGTRQISINTTGQWELTTTELPKWLTLTPTSGSGSASLSLTIAKNHFVKDRTFELAFRNTLIDMSAVLTVNQAKNPSSAIDDYKYLGKGYDASGEFATDSYVKAQLLDWNLLVDNGYIADIIVASSTYEHRVYQKTLQEFQKELNHKAGISMNYGGFSAAVQGSYSTKTLTSQENQFASFRHITQKQVVKLGEHLDASDLKKCLSETAAAELNGSAMSAEQIVQKYGTHLIAGFVLGGSLDYTMTADASSLSKEVDWGVAVEAGYQSKSAGVKGNYSYDQYESMKNESTNFEEKLVARGGDSQLASLLGTEQTRAEWLNSLSDPQKWVMVDYAGRMLIPIWEFADAAARKTAIEAAALAHIQKSLIPQTSSHKTLQLQAYELMYMDSDQDNQARIAYKMTATVDAYTEETFGVTYTEEGGKGDVYVKPEGAEAVAISHMTKGYKFSIYRPHTLTVKITGKDKDFNLNDDDPFEMTATYNYNTSTGKWTEQGGTTEYDNGSEFWIETTADGKPGGKTQAKFHFRLHWK